MPSKPRTKPRKSPSQERSKVTVDAILQAAARILVKEGYVAASTNRIAAEAGVSIGSLYQYFPSREAIIGALVDQMFAEEMAIIEPRLAQAADKSLPEVARELVQAVLDYHAAQPALRKVIVEQVPRVGKLAQRMDNQSRIAELVLAYLRSCDESLRPKDLELAAFLVVHAVDAAIQAVVVKRPDYLKDRRLTDELCALVVGYARSG